MEKLGFSEEEIADILKSDDEIDHGAKLFELDAEKEKNAKKARCAGTRKAESNVKKNRKKNEIKAEIIEKLFNFLLKEADFQNLEIANAERMIKFSVGELNFDLTLVQKRDK